MDTSPVTVSVVTADDVCRAVDRLAIGELAPFHGRLVAGADGRRSVCADALLDTDMRRVIEARFTRRFARFDPRVVHSIWMKWYLYAFLPAILLADLSLMRTLPVALGKIRFVIGDDERVVAVAIGGAGDDTSGADAFVRFEGLVFDHFMPLIESWSQRTGVTRRVFWSNVGNTFEAMIRKVEEVCGPSERLAEAQRLLAMPSWRDGRPNPLHDVVRYVTEAGRRHRRRRVCCLQYMLPDRRFCSACPVVAAGRAMGEVAILD